MEDILYPSKIELLPGASRHEAVLVAEPFFQGYGMTVGSALRRVLLSSLPGAAITAVKIKGVQHEFSTLPQVKEDVLEIILNLKMVRLKSFSAEPVRLRLAVKGEKEVTAGDIQATSDVEIANPKLHLATLTDKNAELEMEVLVERGRGYLPTEERGKEKKELGLIAVDALFSPVINVGIRVENVRVGEITNYDKLILTVETDGTITAKQAIEESSRVLINHFNLFGSLTDLKGEVAEEGEAPAKPKRGRKKKAEEEK
ncbi:DNA-directed RNA polymerase subunit alpha [Patescibacteria group bacterium]|nr:MAG: DNA-directed RNA polymerase subunit alpha [Patescibacteria group bacterium]